MSSAPCVRWQETGKIGVAVENQMPSTATLLIPTLKTTSHQETCVSVSTPYVSIISCLQISCTYVLWKIEEDLERRRMERDNSSNTSNFPINNYHIYSKLVKKIIDISLGTSTLYFLFLSPWQVVVSWKTTFRHQFQVVEKNPRTM